MKIVLIGPVYPYKGGIAHYTSLMYKTLSETHDVKLISYSMQYPKILFRKEQKDYTNKLFEVANVEFLLNTANLMSILHVARYINQWNPDMVVFQWWHPYFAPCYYFLSSWLSKSIKKCFICHNVFPHERFPLDRKLAKMSLSKGDCFVVQSRSDEADLLTIKPYANLRYNPHPTYNIFKLKDMTKEEARKLIDIPMNKRVLLFFGFVREYKGLKHLINAMPLIKKKMPDVLLMIIGAFSEDKKDYLKMIKDNQVEDVVYLKDDYTPDNEVEKYFSACDMVVLPYESATQSGIVQIAYGFEKPVLATAVGGLPDVVEDGVSGYIVHPKSPQAIADAVFDYYLNNREEKFISGVKAEAYKFDWKRIKEKIEELSML